MDTIAQRLAGFRENTGLHKKAFAEKIGLDSGLYGRYESGTNKPSFETLEKIAASFPKLSLNWLLTGKGEMLLNKAPESPAAGLVSGPATVAEAENILLRQQLAGMERQIADKEKLIDRLWAMLPAKLGKMLSSSDAAGSWFPPLAPSASAYSLSH